MTGRRRQANYCALPNACRIVAAITSGQYPAAARNRMSGKPAAENARSRNSSRCFRRGAAWERSSSSTAATIFVVVRSQSTKSKCCLAIRWPNPSSHLEREHEIKSAARTLSAITNRGDAALSKTWKKAASPRLRSTSRRRYGSGLILLRALLRNGPELRLTRSLCVP